MSENPRLRVFFDEWVEERKKTQPAVTDTAVAEKAGISTTHLNQLKKGKRRWNVDNIVDVADALGLKDPRDLLRHPDDVPPGDDVWRRIPEQDRARARQLLESFAAPEISPHNPPKARRTAH